MDQPKPRVNGSMLPKYQGQCVCLLGTVKNIDGNGQSFVMTLSDGVDVDVFVQDPLQDMIEGLTEVVGEVGADARQIQCQHYINHGTVDFDLNLYDEACKMTQEFPDFYKVGVTAPPAQ
ncbi:replication protein A 14 kDa subunit-like [Amphiura filiformis]|uniref:replication protein A 14 kDa subunit-like n=1 Tax=Amphiura filiformis TaxID=82378 RepID=UPI003B2287E2